MRILQSVDSAIEELHKSSHAHLDVRRPNIRFQCNEATDIDNVSNVILRPTKSCVQ